jgi:hypothetical protein
MVQAGAATAVRGAANRPARVKVFMICCLTAEQERGNHQRTFGKHTLYSIFAVMIIVAGTHFNIAHLSK